eukprot:749914-Hanusia_phi.AAC.6
MARGFEQREKIGLRQRVFARQIRFITTAALIAAPLLSRRKPTKAAHAVSPELSGAASRLSSEVSIDAPTRA